MGELLSLYVLKQNDIWTAWELKLCTRINSKSKDLKTIVQPFRNMADGQAVLLSVP